jgi:hypothetical protein
VPQESEDVLGYHLFVDIEVDQTIPFMAQATIVEITIEGEKCRPVQLMQQRNQFVVFHALPPNVLANLPESDALRPQEDALTLGDVFIQDVHAGWGSSAYSAA